MLALLNYKQAGTGKINQSRRHRKELEQQAQAQKAQQDFNIQQHA